MQASPTASQRRGQCRASALPCALPSPCTTLVPKKFALMRSRHSTSVRRGCAAKGSPETRGPHPRRPPSTTRSPVRVEVSPRSQASAKIPWLRPADPRGGEIPALPGLPPSPGSPDPPPRSLAKAGHVPGSAEEGRGRRGGGQPRGHGVFTPAGIRGAQPGDLRGGLEARGTVIRRRPPACRGRRRRPRGADVSRPTPRRTPSRRSRSRSCRTAAA
jgi:hypothetical protein